MMSNFIGKLRTWLLKCQDGWSLEKAISKTFLIKIDEPVEEETLPLNQPKAFYPVHQGMVFERGYKVLGKLGYGANATVWIVETRSESVFSESDRH